MMWFQALLAGLLVLQCYADLTEEHRQLSDSNTNFGLNLLHLAQTQKPGNTFLSPFSISTALTLAYLGAEGRTKEEMAAGLGLDQHANAYGLFKTLNDHLFSDKAEFTLRQANRLYADNQFTVKEDYLTEAAKYFEAPLQKVDFRDDQTRLDINSWIEQQTEDRIKDMIQKGDLEGAVMVLVNAIYFKAIWQSPFSPRMTSDAKFKLTERREVDVENMKITSPFKVGKIPGVNARMLEMNYRGGEASMYIILPDSTTGLCDVQATISAENINKAIDGLKPSHTKVVLPKFELNYRLELSPILKTLGMSHMFSNDADFSRISDDPTKISNVIHQSFVRVDENGTEAAAATVVTMVRTSIPIVETEFIVDHPFIFVIREKASRSVLFMGRVVDPTDEVKDFENDEEAYKCNIKVEKLRTVSDKNRGERATPLFLLYTFIFAALTILL